MKKIAPRFPSICVRLGKGLFWYYLEEAKTPPQVVKEGCQPLLPMRKKEMRKCALRILYYENRIAVEFFHALTDGSGALVFLKSLAAAYLEEFYGEKIPKTEGILSAGEKPEAEELEDAFLRYAGSFPAKRETESAFSLKGIPEPDGFLHVTTATVPLDQALSIAKENGVSLTTLLASVLCVNLEKIQRSKVARRKEKAVRIQIPVNLRKHFPSKTLRNFVAVYNVGMEKGETDAEMKEVLSRIHHQMALFNTPRNLCATFTANVNSEKGIGIRLVPLFLKNIVMRAVFDRVGESLACLCLSNLGGVKLPSEMEEKISHFDFIIGPQAKAPYNCGVVSFGNELRISLVRNTVEPELEREFFPYLSSLGLSVTLESNER
ncbi:MAG: alcohol acetyltransferase [Clostridia bacterium]|nr:alcohol acetyltransferase [Clostridia bacterium]